MHSEAYFQLLIAKWFSRPLQHLKDLPWTPVFIQGCKFTQKPHMSKISARLTSCLADYTEDIGSLLVKESFCRIAKKVFTTTVEGEWAVCIREKIKELPLGQIKLGRYSDEGFFPDREAEVDYPYRNAETQPKYLPTNHEPSFDRETLDSYRLSYSLSTMQCLPLQESVESSILLCTKTARNEGNKYRN